MSSEYKISWQTPKKTIKKQHERIVDSSLHSYKTWISAQPNISQLAAETSRQPKPKYLPRKGPNGTLEWRFSFWNFAFLVCVVYKKEFCLLLGLVTNCAVLHWFAHFCPWSNVWYVRRWTCEWKEHLKRYQKIPTNHTHGSDCILSDTASVGSVHLFLKSCSQNKGDCSSCTNDCNPAIERFAVNQRTLICNRFASTTIVHFVCVLNHYNWWCATSGKCCTERSLELHSLFYGQVEFRFFSFYSFWMQDSRSLSWLLSSTRISSICNLTEELSTRAEDG